MVETMLAGAASAVLGKVGGLVVDEVRKRLAGDPVQKEFRRVLGAGVESYVNDRRLEVFAALLGNDGVLADTTVAAELAHFLDFQGDPDPAILAERWREAVAGAPAEFHFGEESASLLAAIKQEMLRSQVFQPVLAARSLAALEDTSHMLIDIEQQLARQEDRLDALVDLSRSGFAELIRAVGRLVPGLRDQARDFTGDIAQLTAGFVGRDHVFSALDRFMSEQSSGWFFVEGDPGVGKSAVAARIVEMRGCIHHFNIATKGIVSLDAFLSNVCAQLIGAYALDYRALPDRATQDGGFLGELLHEIAVRFPQQQHLIVIDAVDEASAVDLPPNANPLCLPAQLDGGVFIVLTARRLQKELFFPYGGVKLGEGDESNRDIRVFLADAVSRPGIVRYLSAQTLDSAEFIEKMADKAAGNFMYLRYLLPELEAGTYTGRDITELPPGLTHYYYDHWRRMRGRDEQAWFDYKLSIVVALTLVPEPVPIEILSRYSGVEDLARVRQVVREWLPFLREERIEAEGSTGTGYRLYHLSFLEFVRGLQEVKDERVNLPEALRRAADAMLEDLEL